MAIDINYFLNQKCQEIELDRVVYTEELYNNVADERLKYIFSILHQEFNRLIKYMYSKTNYHFNAKESRELINYIKIYEDTKYILRNTDNAFEMNSEYDKFLKYCNTFLVKSGGSEIPNSIHRIELKEYEPIFYFACQIEVKNIKDEIKYSIKLIGEGSYAKVYKYYDEFYNQIIVIKRANTNLTSKELERFKKEYEVMEKFNSPYVLNVYKYDTQKNEYYAEYADMTLYDYIQKNNQKISMKERYNIIMQVLKGFSYIHSKGMLHRDISVTNILIKIYDDVTRVKISDFGLVKEKNSNFTSLDSEIKGSLNDESNLRVIGFANYSMLHETYALTRLVLYILTGKSNLDKVNDNNIRNFVLKGTNGDLSKRYTNVNEIAKEFNNLYKKIA